MQALDLFATSWFVLPWYALGVLSAIWIVHDLRTANTPLPPAMKLAWPIIAVFFSILGLALYFGTARAPGIERIADPEGKKRAHSEFEKKSMFRRVNGAVIHCVAGDGLGIMTAMVIARLLSMSFWQEFWFEYAVGFAFGWFIFQYMSMRKMTDSRERALAMAFRAEFFSMLSVMGGMGAVMTFVTPSIVGMQPRPSTFAFWGFGMLGLVVGYVLTIPTNWMLVALGWKKKKEQEEARQPARPQWPRPVKIAAMCVWAFAGFVIPAWLTEVREARAVAVVRSSAAIDGMPPAFVLHRGLEEDLEVAVHGFDRSRRVAAVTAMDAAMRVSDVGHAADPAGGFDVPLERIREARRDLQNGHRGRARDELRRAAETRVRQAGPGGPVLPVPAGYREVPVLDANGALIGEVRNAGSDHVRVTLGPGRDVWGFLDLPSRRDTTLAGDEVIYGPRRVIGKSYVLAPTLGATRPWATRPVTALRPSDSGVGR